MLTYSFAAVAVVDLDADVPDAASYARETLSTGSVTTGNADGETYFTVNDAGNNLDITSVIGAGILPGAPVYLRFDFIGGVLPAGNNAVLQIAGSGADILLSLGGAAGDNFAIYAFTPSAVVDQTDAVSLTLDQMGVPGVGDVGLTYSLYSTLTDAIFAGATLYSNTISGYVKTNIGSTAAFTLGENTAELSTGFINFDAGSISPTLARVGTVSSNPVSGALSAATGSALSINDIAVTVLSPVVFEGDFSFGSWFMDDDPACASPDVDLTASIGNGDGTTAFTDLSTISTSGFVNLCVQVDGFSDVIPEQEYTVDADFFPATSGFIHAPFDIFGTLGVIDRNGTRVRISVLSTYLEYNQRLVLVNYSSREVDYELSFLAEEGVSTTPLDPATGTLAEGEKRVIKVTDLVVIEGGTRAAAMLNANVVEGSLGVATTQVNLEDGGTDTVLYR